MDKAEPLRRFITGMPSGRCQPAQGDATLSGVFVETEDKTGKAVSVQMVRLRRALGAVWPMMSRALPYLALGAMGAGGATIPLTKVAVSTGHQQFGLIFGS